GGESEGVGGGQRQLSHWSPPEPKFGAVGRDARRQAPAAASKSVGRAPSVLRRPRTWPAIPAWAQAAAAVLLLGVSAGLANLSVRYDRNGLTVRTGWWRVSDERPAAAASVQDNAAAARAQLSAMAEKVAALERDLRAVQASSVRAAEARPGATDAELLRKVHVLVDESERRQKTELALRLAQALTDYNAQRQADLRRIE